MLLYESFVRVKSSDRGSSFITGDCFWILVSLSPMPFSYE